ncbi:hypothetical protein Tco_0658724 [Tanacetum coccineum]
MKVPVCESQSPHCGIVVVADRSKEEGGNLSDVKLKEMKAFEKEREKFMKMHKEKMAEMKTRHWREVLEMEAGFNTI